MSTDSEIALQYINTRESTQPFTGGDGLSLFEGQVSDVLFENELFSGKPLPQNGVRLSPYRFYHAGGSG